MDRIIAKLVRRNQKDETNKLFANLERDVMSKISENFNAGSASLTQDVQSYVLEVVETFVKSDLACNEQSPTLPTYYEWEMAENHEEPPPLIWVSTVSGKDDTSPALAQFTFDEFESFCSKPELSNKVDGPAFSPCTLLKPYSNSVQDACCSLLAFGFDYLPDTITSKQLMACIPDYQAFCFSTHYHKCFGNLNSYCLIVQLDAPIDAIQYQVVATEFAKKFGSMISHVDEVCLCPTEMLHFPSCPVNQVQEFEFSTNDGKPLDGSQMFDIWEQ